MTILSVGIILTTQFTVPTARSFSDYLKYITREKALLEIDIRSPTENEELDKVQSALNELSVEPGETSSSIDHRKNLKDIEEQAKKMLMDDGYISDDFTKYVSYMAREYALEKKPNLSGYEQIELDRVRQTMQQYSSVIDQNKTKKLNGVFSESKDVLSKSDLPRYSKLFAEAQKNGSILYQDVISHDNTFLEELGLYDSKTDTLNEEALIHSGQSMMNELLAKEGLDDSAFWMASIHRNTKHIHIHFAVAEVQNTRELKKVKIDGTEFVQPKGMRKQSTLDQMKETYGRELRDFALGNERIRDLERKSKLRNQLVIEIRGKTPKLESELTLLNEIYKGLPDNKNHWNYGDKNKSKIPIEVRNKIDTLTHSLLSESNNYKEYLSLIKEEQKMKLKMFGTTKQEDKNYLKNSLFDIKKRVGNAFLKELKQQDKLITDRQTSCKENPMISEELNIRETKMNGTKRNATQRKRPILMNKNLYKLNNAIDRAARKDKELYEYEVLKRRIEFEQSNR